MTYSESFVESGSSRKVPGLILYWEGEKPKASGWVFPGGEPTPALRATPPERGFLGQLPNLVQNLGSTFSSRLLVPPIWYWMCQILDEGLRFVPLGKGSCEKIENQVFPARSVRRSARSTRWNARSARVFGCRFRDGSSPESLDSIFSQLQG